MDFSLKTHCNFHFHNFHCALPKDMVDMEMTIQMVVGIHIYRRDRTTQLTSYNPWSRQVKPFSSHRKKIAKKKKKKKKQRKEGKLQKEKLLSLDLSKGEQVWQEEK